MLLMGTWTFQKYNMRLMVYFYWSVSLQRNQVKSQPCCCPPPRPISTRTSQQHIFSYTSLLPQKESCHFWLARVLSLLAIDKESVCRISLKLIAAWISLVPISGPPALKPRILWLRTTKEKRPHLSAGQGGRESRLSGECGERIQGIGLTEIFNQIIPCFPWHPMLLIHGPISGTLEQIPFASHWPCVLGIDAENLMLQGLLNNYHWSICFLIIELSLASLI